MAEWIEMQTKHRGYRDPRTGKMLESIEGRRNRPGIDEFESLGHEYPDLSGVTIRSWWERGETLLLLIEGTRPKGAVGLTDTEALERLKTKIGLPEDTTLSSDKKPIIPKEIDQ